MTVVFTRTMTPVSGHLDDTMKFAKARLAALKKAYDLDINLNVRFGGPAGQLNMVSYHEDMAALENVRRKVIAGVADGTIPQPEPGIVAHVEDAVWMRL